MDNEIGVLNNGSLNILNIVANIRVKLNYFGYRW